MGQRNGRDVIVRVRDRRARHQFSIHNRVMDEWYPIVGAPGFALYGLYCRMANKRDERSWMPYSTIQAHMGMGPGTISDYNKLLVWCKLIHIEEGDSRLANDYYILNIPLVTDEALAAVREAALADQERRTAVREERAVKFDRGGLSEKAAKVREKGVDKFVNMVLKRLDKWEPLQTQWKKNKERPTVVRPPAQMSLFSDGDSASPAELNDSQGKNGASQETAVEPVETAVSPPPAPTNDDSNITAILDWMGFNGRLTEKDKSPTVHVLLSWAYWVRVNDEELKKQDKNAVGIARAGWRRGDLPGGGFSTLAQTWLDLDDTGREELMDVGMSSPFSGRTHMTRDLEELGVTEPVLNIFCDVYQATDGDAAPRPLLPNDEV